MVGLRFIVCIFNVHSLSSSDLLYIYMQNRNIIILYSHFLNSVLFAIVVKHFTSISSINYTIRCCTQLFSKAINQKGKAILFKNYLFIMSLTVLGLSVVCRIFLVVGTLYLKRASSVLEACKLYLRYAGLVTQWHVGL